MRLRDSASVALLCTLAPLGNVGCRVDRPGFESPEPCTRDALGCGASLRYELDEDCELAEPLRVTMGHGDNGFFAFLPAEVPHLASSSSGGQGGSVRHVALAVRVENPDDEHQLFQVLIFLEEPLFEVGSAGTDAGPATEDGTEWETIDERRMVLGDANMRHGEGGALEQWGLNLLLGSPSSLSGVARLRTTVRDSCDRYAEDVHEFVWP